MTDLGIAARAATRAGYQRIGFALGPLVGLLLLLLPAPEGLSLEGWRVVALAAWMAIWWATEAIPVPATSLLPIIALPLLGVSGIAAATAPFANPVIFLLLGGFVIALSLEEWGLHRRIALGVLARVGDHKLAMLAGFMGVAAFLSMWISNTATTMMMMPIALSVAGVVGKGKAGTRDGEAFTVMLLLGIAYAASIGGMGTLIGTTTNAVAVGYLRDAFAMDLGFADWLAFGLPAVVVLVPAAWAILTLLLRWRLGPQGLAGAPDASAFIRHELALLGPMTRPEKRVAWLCCAVALLWIARPAVNAFLGARFLTDAGIAILGAVALFVIPAGDKQKRDAFLLDWRATTRMNWGVLLLFGGGMSLASAVDGSGLALWLGGALAGLTALPLPLLMLILVTLVVFLTELTSNTATIATLMPILGALATAGGFDPLLLAAPVAMAASAAFMLPVATGPNAVVFGSGHVHVPDMAKTGFWLNLAAIAGLTAIGALWVPLLLGVR
ncbi:MAG: SLC13 family permease [Pseudomonadota bacterium]